MVFNNYTKQRIITLQKAIKPLLYSTYISPNNFSKESLPTDMILDRHNQKKRRLQYAH